MGSIGNIKLVSLIEMSIGAAVGAITFSGSIIAFLKLRGIMSGAPITFSGQHILNLILGVGIFVLIFLLCNSVPKYFLDNNYNFISCWCFINYTYWRCRYACSNFNAYPYSGGPQLE